MSNKNFLLPQVAPGLHLHIPVAISQYLFASQSLFIEQLAIMNMIFML